MKTVALALLAWFAFWFAYYFIRAAYRDLRGKRA